MGMIGLDTETALVSDEAPAPPVTCAQLAIDDEVAVLHVHDPETPGMLREVLQETLAMANAPYDFGVISEEWPDLEPYVWTALREDRVVDVLTRERVIDIASVTGLSRNEAKYGLGAVTKRWCGHELDKKTNTRKGYGDLRDVPIERWPEDARRYAEEDPRWTLRSAEAQLQYARDFETEHGLPLFTDAARQARAHWALHLGSLHGVHTDPARVAELGALLETKQAELFAKLQHTRLVDAKGVKKQARLQEVLQDAGVTTHTDGCKCERCQPRLDEHKPPRLKADAETLETLDLPPKHPLWAYREYARCQKMRGTYWQPMRAPLIRTRYIELVSNGRTSSREPNLQNLPKQHILETLLGIEWGFRECLVPAEGNVFVTADFAKAELVSWAQVLIENFGWDAPTAALAHALREGRDVHDELLKEMGGTDRTLAKMGNFGLMGGAGPNRIIAEAISKYGMRLEFDAVSEMKQAWLRRWAGGWYFAWIQDHMVDDRMDFVHSSGRIARGLRYSDACNYPFSGRTADATKDCLWRLAVEMYTEHDSPLYGARQPLFVHDENVLECRREHAERVAVRLEEVMKATYADWCPDVPVGVDVKIQERYSK